MDKEKINKILQYQVPPKIVNALGFVVLYVFSCLVFVCNAEAVAVVDDSLNPFIFWTDSSFGGCAYVTLLVIFGILYCLVGNLFVAYIIMELITICWGIANRIVFFTRDQFITIAEFDVLGEAAGVEVDMGTIFHPIIIVLVVIGCFNGLLLWLLSRKSRRDNNVNQNRKKNLIIRLTILPMLVIIFVVMHAKPQQISLEYISAYRKTGNIVWFCQSLFGNATEDVSAEEVREIYSAFEDSILVDNNISEKRPNIIVIMSEAFWDIGNLDGIVDASENPMDKYWELTKDAVTGQVAVNIYGGGTNITEFEFLTGLNSIYMQGANYYNDYYSMKQESMISYMEELGYVTIAFHPYDREFWSREVGYSGMGFDAFYSDADFMNKEMCHGYISDKSLTKEIIERFEVSKEKQPEQPIFTFAVSVQNHVGDMAGFDESNAKTGCTGITTSIIGDQIDEEVSENVEEYYNGLRESIEALAELIRYFDAYEEDTVIVFFGDHAPGFVKRICDTEGREKELNLYRTPYMIWTNYENDYESYGDISMPYLSSVLIEYLELPKPNQYYMNKYMLENYPINTKYEQQYSETLDEQRMLDMMSVVSTISKRFPKEEMALPFWQIAE